DTSGNGENNRSLSQLLAQIEQDQASTTMLEAMPQLELPISEPPITTATLETDADENLLPDLSQEEDSFFANTLVSSVHRHSESEADEITLSSTPDAIEYGSQSAQTIRTRHGRKRVLQLMLLLLVIVVVISSALWLSNMSTSNFNPYTTENMTQEIATPTNM